MSEKLFRTSDGTVIQVHEYAVIDQDMIRKVIDERTAELATLNQLLDDPAVITIPGKQLPAEPAPAAPVQPANNPAPATPQPEPAVPEAPVPAGPVPVNAQPEPLPQIDQTQLT